MRHGHEKAGERSLAFHRLALEKLRQDPAGARRRILAVLDRWSVMPHLKRQAALLDAWRRILDLPPDEVEARILSAESQQLRQCSPLGVLIDPRDRYLVYRALART